MSSAEFKIVIKRPVNQVFAYAIDVAHLPEWNEVIEDSWMTAGQVSDVGARYIVKARAFGRTMEIPSEVIAVEPNRVFAYKAGGSMPYRSTRTFEETAQGTLVTERIELEFRDRFSRLASPLVLRAMKRSHQKNIELLKAVLEGQQGNQRGFSGKSESIPA